jgi:3-hydroxymyristoyl/3-hydroxydecanoyl-(acyl carrier protein) dehydratase
MNPEKIFHHKAPFLFVDEIIEMRHLEYSKGIKKVKNDEFWVEGHFPDDPIFPGVLLLETMAQIGGLVLVKSDQKKLNAYLSKVDKFKLIKKVVPRDEVIIEGIFLDQIGDFTKVKTKAFVNQVSVAEAEITYVSRNRLEG